jgi:hypothetical protein
MGVDLRMLPKAKRPVRPMRSAGEKLASRQTLTLLEPRSLCSSRANQGPSLNRMGDFARHSKCGT